jgi:Fic-DOC domain mobile mystery protein B
VNSDLFVVEPGNTELTAEEKLELIPSLSTRAELNEFERENFNAARVWAMRRHTLDRSDLLTDAFSRELHKRMFNHVWRWSGKYRATVKNLGWEFPRITEGVRNAFDDARAWAEFSTYPIDEAAVRLHHRLVSIHPWPNGNGRRSLLIADVMIAAHGSLPLTWGARGNLAGNELRRQYITALKQADAGLMAPLVEFARSSSTATTYASR